MGLFINNISKSYITRNNKIIVLENINLDVRCSEFICIIGPSGCGKTTLLNIISGLDKATEGRMEYNGKEIRLPGIDRAVVFQEVALFPWLNVFENVEFGMKVAKIPKVQRKEKVLKYLQMVHLQDFQNSYIHELSGGMKQRVALARALTLDSQILLMDEPFAALDSKTKHNLHFELQQIWHETKKTIIFITHNLEEAVTLADRVIIMSSRPGRIKKEFIIDLPRPRLSNAPIIKEYAEEMLLQLDMEGEYYEAYKEDGM